MAFGLKKEETNASQPLPAPVPAPKLAAPAAARGGRSSGLGVDGICLVVAAVALLAAIGSSFFVMKALFVF